MSLHILPPNGDKLNSADAVHSTRSWMLRAALKYAERGIPVFPCGPNKRPIIPKCEEAERNKLVGEALAEHARKCSHGGHGFHDATTDRSRITAHWNRWPNALIGIPTGRRSGFFVTDVDDLAAYKKLVREHGKLPGAWTVRTPRGGLHLYLKHRDGITNSPGGLPDGIDIRGQGGYVTAPPSPGYEVIDRSPVAEAPEWLLKLIQERRPETPRRPSRSRERVEIQSGEPIPEGQRNQALFFIALSIKDRGKSREEVLAELLTINQARCKPPLDAGEVEKIVKSIMRYPIRSGSPSPELVEAVRQMIRAWWEYHWRGLGGQSDRDLLWMLLELAIRYGRLNPDGSVDVDAAVRTLSLAASVSYVTISRGCTKRLEEAGWVEKIPSDDPRKGATWRIRVPSRVVNTSSIDRGDAGLLTTRDALPEETPCWRHRGLVGKGAGGVEALLEVYGPMSRDEVAEALGWSNAREVERRYLRKLESQGLAEKRDDGRYALVEDHAEVVGEVKATPYAVLLRRERKEWDPRTQSWEITPAEYGREASEDQRTETDREKHEKNREDWRAARILRELVRDDAEDAFFEELPPATTEMLAANRVGRYLLARGWRRWSKREWVNPQTGEIMPADRAMGESA